MNIKTPLAALLLTATATAAMAQFGRGGGAPTANPLLGGGRGGAVASDADMIFKCGTPPYIACTTAQLSRREAIRTSGRCPDPATKACMDFLMRNGENASVQLLGNQSNPSTADAGIAAKCGTSGYRACTAPEIAERAAFTAAERAAMKEWEASHPMIAPKPKGDIELPAENPGYPPAFAPGDFQGALTFARATQESGEDKAQPVVDLGGNRYGIVQKSGEVQVCGAGMKCGDLRPASEFPDLAARIQEAGSRNSGAKTINADNPTGAPKVASTASAEPASPASNAARDLGAEIAGEQGALAKGFGTSPASAGDDDGDAGGETAPKPRGTLKVSAEALKAELDKDGYTYIKINEAAKNSRSIINGGNATFNAAAASGRPAEPVVDETVGKTKASANAR